ncbi:unnamed protein product [Rangifer tarandus platyrhynchus]|uniref:Uncharacterized protein n=1 Tax=Rangifer tarandus platyrhynchus TaxID=3082113 RepID=A0ABN9A692_RANTA|nr:unnamed protein product [Rangifer tarandus platyrhynchus]
MLSKAHLTSHSRMSGSRAGHCQPTPPPESSWTRTVSCNFGVLTGEEDCMSFYSTILKGQQTGSNLGKKYIKAMHCHPSYLTDMHSVSCEMPGWMQHKLDSRLLGEISITSDMEMTPPLWQKAKRK